MCNDPAWKGLTGGPSVCSPCLKCPLGSSALFPFHFLPMPPTTICLSRSCHMQITAHSSLIMSFLITSVRNNFPFSAFRWNLFWTIYRVLSHIALDSNLSNLLYKISIILSIRNCKSQVGLGYSALENKKKKKKGNIQWHSYKCMILFPCYISISSELGFHETILHHVEKWSVTITRGTWK